MSLGTSQSSAGLPKATGSGLGTVVHPPYGLLSQAVPKKRAERAPDAGISFTTLICLPAARINSFAQASSPSRLGSRSTTVLLTRHVSVWGPKSRHPKHSALFRLNWKLTFCCRFQRVVEILPAVLEGCNSRDVPSLLQPLERTHYRLPDGDEDLYRRVTGKYRVLPLALGDIVV